MIGATMFFVGIAIAVTYAVFAVVALAALMNAVRRTAD